MRLARSRDPHNERVTVGNFIDTAPDTLNSIEKAWVDEVDTNKRGRGTITGISNPEIIFWNGNTEADLRLLQHPRWSTLW